MTNDEGFFATRSSKIMLMAALTVAVLIGIFVQPGWWM